MLKQRTIQDQREGNYDPNVARAHRANKITAGDLKLIRNKSKRREILAQIKRAKKVATKERVKKEKELAATLGDKAPPRQQPRSIDKLRVPDDSIVDIDDAETIEDEATDEFAQYFLESKKPNPIITTGVSCNRGTGRALAFIKSLLGVVPELKYYRRQGVTLKKIIEFGIEKEVTDVIVVNEKDGKVSDMIVCHLPKGPTAHFRISNLMMPEKIFMGGEATKHRPELIMNNFTTRMGHTVGRLLVSLFPQDPQFFGRQVVTFHNQRDYIFFRFHRYIFEQDSKNKEVGYKARIQELGPRFTMKLYKLQHGTFDSVTGEYEFVLTPKMQMDRKRFFI